MNDSPRDPQRTWYLKDEPLTDLGDGDKFSHRAYVNLLTKAIAELKPPFTLGVFGKWGVGKTSIINDLSDRLRKGDAKTRAVTIDVWKYRDDSLRRQFLYDLQKQLHDQKALPKGKDYVREVYEEYTEELPGRQYLDPTRLKALAIPLLLTYIVAVGLLWGLLKLGATNPVQAWATAIVAPVALYLVSEFSRHVTVVSKDTITRPVYFSEDQFERKFEEMVGDSKCRKLVIIVDNLDRCSHELAIHTLGAIKTFLEPKGAKCIFVIPCDDAAIRRHVKAAYGVFDNAVQAEETPSLEQSADEYLRKFFNGAVRIDSFLPEEMEPYIAHLVDRTLFAKDMPPEEILTLVQMVGFLFRENPRQIKQFLNNLASKYLLVQERESGLSPQIRPRISDKKLFLAKVAAIESRFSSLSRKFIDDDNLYPEVAVAATTPGKTAEVKKLLGEDSADATLLESFLRTYGHVTADNPKAFFHLKQSEQEARIPNYAQFDSALRRNEADVVKKAYEDGQDEDNAARTDVLVRSITGWAANGWTDYALNAVRVAAVLRPSLATDGERLSREVVRALATVPGLLGAIQRIRDPGAIFAMTDHALKSHRQTVLDTYVDIFAAGPGSQEAVQDDSARLQDEIASSFVAHVDALRNEQRSRIKSSMLAWPDPRPTLLAIMSSTEEAKRAFIDHTVLVKLVSHITADDIDLFVKSRDEGQQGEHHPAILALMRCSDLDGRPLANEAAGKFSDLLGHAIAQGSEPLFWYTVDVILEVQAVLDQAEAESIEGLAGHLRTKYQSANPEQKTLLMRILCRLYGGASGGEKSHIDNILISDFTGTLGIAHVLEVLELRSGPEYSALPWNEIDNRMAERLMSTPDEDQANEEMAAVARRLAEVSPAILVPLLVRLLERPEIQRAVNLVVEAIKHLPQGNRGKGLAAPVLDATLTMSGPQGHPEGRQLLLEFAYMLKDLHTREYESKLDSHLGDLITGGGAPINLVGVQLLDTGVSEGVISHERHAAVLVRLFDWLVQHPADVPLQPPQPQILDSIMSAKNRVLAKPSQRETMVGWLAARQEFSLPKAERQQTRGHLISFGRLSQDVLQDLIPRLVYQAQNESDVPTRDATIDALLTLYRYNRPDDNDLWNDLRQYRLSLLNGNDEQRPIGRGLDREMRKIRKGARQEGHNEA